MSMEFERLNKSVDLVRASVSACICESVSTLMIRGRTVRIAVNGCDEMPPIEPQSGTDPLMALLRLRGPQCPQGEGDALTQLVLAVGVSG